MMDATTWIDLGTLTVLLMSFVVVVLAGYLNQKFELELNRSLQASFLLIFVSTFLLLNGLYSVEEVRIIVGIIFVAFIIPFSITFLSIWILVNKPTMTRIQYVSFISWIISLAITMSLRALFGWGFPTTALGITVFTAISAVADGLLGGIIGNLLIKKLEKYRPTPNANQDST